MARMSIDDGLGRDTRLEDLAELCGWTIREAAGCLQLDIWPLCYDRVTPNIRPRDIDRAANRRAVSPVKHPGGFSAALIESKLGRPATKQDAFYLWVKSDGSKVQLPWRDTEWQDRIYICGAAERIAYLLKKEEAGRVGGLKSAESRAINSKRTPSTASRGALSTRSPSANPSSTPTASVSPSALAPVPDGVGDPVPEGDPLSLGLSEFQDRVDQNADLARQAAARRILDRLTEANGVAYTSPEHLELVADRLDEGITEFELRAVIAYCADTLGWALDDRFRTNLAPSTLFGRNIAKYLDPARAEYADEIAEAKKRGAA